MIKIAIVTGSTRPGRNNEAVARWVYEIAKSRSDAEFELVDIADYNLPLLDEPVPPAMGQYSHAGIQPRHLGRAQECHRLSVSRVEQQSGRIRELRERGRHTGRRTAAPGHGRAYDRRRARAGDAFSLHRF
jgi:hypothetical protein